MPIVTQELIESGISSNGGWGLAQLKTILAESEFCGLKPTEFPRKGWRDRAIGREIGQEQYEQFLRLKNKHLIRTIKLKEQRAKQQTFADLPDPYETDLYPGKTDVSPDEQDMLCHLNSIKREG